MMMKSYNGTYVLDSW